MYGYASLSHHISHNPSDFIFIYLCHINHVILVKNTICDTTIPKMSRLVGTLSFSVSCEKIEYAAVLKIVNLALKIVPQ